uniref:Carboxylesterase n=1 Tax=Bombyx mandarina TaxID=7092 RepID=B0FGV7_BOMMA|nr:carboxylesterase [Bombyx mandarina]
MLFVIIICVQVLSVFGESPRVTVKHGTLVGSKTKTYSGYEYYEFLQIPYAKAPIGEFRFKSPQPPESWEHERDATSVNQNNVCFQFDIFLNASRGSEDCLYLNVFTPKLPSCDKLLPTMVSIHGGGFVLGNGIIKTENGPDFLIEHDVVVVFINYRLGAFGFLSLDIPEAAGNMGLKDQAMALKWVQENIQQFCGNKDSVTIFGISAGSASVEYLQLSPSSRGLFQQAILQSGSSLNHWAIEYDIKELGFKMANDLGYNGTKGDHRAIYNFIFGKSFEELSDVVLKYSKSSNFKGTKFGFVPSIEKDFGNGEAFLTEYPYQILKEGKFNKVPVIRGFCEFEGYLTAGEKPSDLVEIRQKKNFLDFWAYPLNETDAKNLNEKLRDLYSGDDSAIDFFSDYDFTSGILTSSKLMLQNGVQLYLYNFAYYGNMNFLKILFDLKLQGAAHGDDTAYIIYMPSLINEKVNDEDFLISKRLTKMWTDFAKTQNPTPTETELTPIVWPLFDLKEQKYLTIDRELKLKNHYSPTRMAVFEEIYEKYQK